MDLLSSLRGLSKPQKAIVLTVLVGGIWKAARLSSKSSSSGKAVANASKDKEKTSFLQRLRKILAILLTGYDRAAIFTNLGMLTFLLVMRSILSVQVAVRTGEIAHMLVQQNWDGFLRSVAKFALMGVPAAVVNSGLKYSSSMISLRFRRKLTAHINKHYIVGVNFYKANQLPSTKIDNVDQRVTADVESFCSELSELYTSIFKPVLDIALNTAKLSTVMGHKAPVVLFAYYLVLAQIKLSILRVIQLKKMTQQESEMQGDYRTAHSRLITYAEEIAFFEGSAREQDIITRLFNKLFNHTAFVHKLHFFVGVIDQYLIKYGASITGYGLLCLPAFFPQDPSKPQSVADLTRGYVLNRQLLMDLAGAIGMLLSTTTKIATFSGMTTRVSEVLERVKFLKEDTTSNFTLRPNEEKLDMKEEAKAITTDEWLEVWRLRGEESRRSGKRQSIRQSVSSAKLSLLGDRPGADEDVDSEAARFAETGKGGSVIIKDEIDLKDVSIVSPDGRLLVQGLTVKIGHGMNVMITGPNGSGKSSLFRIIGELWPPYRGVVVKPPKEDIVFVPQKPYLVMGTLRDQIIYPHSLAEMVALGITDDDLTKLLDVVDPARSIVREWKYDDVRNWTIAFSGGQKQRIAMARVFYHRPRYAILDECTSAVSSEVEGNIYMTCRKLKITLFTVSHRAQLQQYHDYQLRFDGHGGWWFKTTAQVEADGDPDKHPTSKSASSASSSSSITITPSTAASVSATDEDADSHSPATSTSTPERETSSSSSMHDSQSLSKDADDLVVVERNGGNGNGGNGGNGNNHGASGPASAKKKGKKKGAK